MVGLLPGIVIGIGCGILAAVLMGIVSDVGYRIGLCKSSILVIDGSFFLKLIDKENGKGRYLAGIPIHLFTGAVFGAIYMAGTWFFGLNYRSPGLVAIYFFLLWLSMLFIALPTAGQGVMGRKASSRTWLEQLFLHAVFGAGYYQALLWLKV